MPRVGKKGQDPIETATAREVQTIPKIGEKAPDFEEIAYLNGEMKKIKLSDYKGKWVVLFFYPLDFTFVCPTEIKGFSSAQKDFEKLGAVIIGASTDSAYSHKAWLQRDLPDVRFPILADTSHKVSIAYGVLKVDAGIANRGTFVIDPNGTLRYAVVSDLGVGRSIRETLRVLQALQTGELCPAEWSPGAKTLGKA